MVRLLKRYRRALPAAVSVLLLAAIFWKIDTAALLNHLRSADAAWFIGALFLFAPQLLLSALRWHILVCAGGNVAFADSFRLVMAAHPLNLCLPAKAGDLAKAVFLKHNCSIPLKTGFSIVVLERVVDLTALSACALLGLLWGWPGEQAGFISLAAAGALLLAALVYFFLHLTAVPSVLTRYRTVGVFSHAFDLIEASQCYCRTLLGSGRAFQAAALTLLLWFAHFAQFICFFQMFAASSPTPIVLACVPLVIMIGLLPISFAGLGTRDAALIWLFSPWDSPHMLAGVGLMSHLRYVIPALLGIPAVRYHLSAIKGAAD